jgi:hypothetical protein
VGPNTSTPFQPIDSTANNEWSVEITRNGVTERIQEFDSARFVNDKRDFDFLCAQSEDGNFVSVRRRGGGGAVSILYTMDPHGDLWIGGVMQMRRNISDRPIFNLMRGYNRPNEDNLSAALREALEESGRTDLMTPLRLKGETLNADSAMNDSRHGGGVDLFRIEVPFEALDQNEDAIFGTTLVFDTSDLTEAQRGEGIYKVLFIRGEPTTVARFADAFTIVGFARLLADLEDEVEAIDHGPQSLRSYDV